MKIQHDLFDAPVNVRVTDPDTSHLAAKRSPLLRACDRKRCLLVHAAHPAGLTDFELAAMIERQQTSAGKRRGELRDAGYVEDALVRRPAPSGSPAIVWRITAAGSAAANLL